jgi:aspartyl-tRNA synthetase
VTGFEVLNEAQTPPFTIEDNTDGGDDLRMKYRYLDIRRTPVRNNLLLRHKMSQQTRVYLDAQQFTEVETPVLIKSTPEGARDFVVPSRMNQGQFYALPQSPQTFKQLLMVAGMDRYYQIVKCFRDEDLRADRQPEFTQLDIEMSFVQREDVLALNEKLLIETINKIYPEKRIQQIPFPRMTYKESMEKYGNDHPDIREDKNDPNLLAFVWVIDFPMFEKTGEDNLDGTGEWTFSHNPFSRPKDEYLEDFMNQKNIGEIISTQYDIVLNGYEIGGGSIRNHKPDALKKTFEIMGYSDNRIEENFGHMIKALGFGAPPHGGIAWGLDRLVMILQNEPNIRETIAFAKTGDGKDLMMNAPCDISDKQKKELGIKVK